MRTQRYEEKYAVTKIRTGNYAQRNRRIRAPNERNDIKAGKAPGHNCHRVKKANRHPCFYSLSRQQIECCDGCHGCATSIDEQQRSWCLHHAIQQLKCAFNKRCRVAIQERNHVHKKISSTFLAHQVCCEHWTKGPSSLRCVKPELAWGQRLVGVSRRSRK